MRAIKVTSIREDVGLRNGIGSAYAAICGAITR